MAQQGVYAAVFTQAIKCLVIPFAFRKSLVAAIDGYTQSAAGICNTMASVASLQFCDLSHLPEEMVQEQVSFLRRVW